MEFGPNDGGTNDERIGVGSVVISKLFLTQDAFFFGTEPIDRE